MLSELIRTPPYTIPMATISRQDIPALLEWTAQMLEQFVEAFFDAPPDENKAFVKRQIDDLRRQTAGGSMTTSSYCGWIFMMADSNEENEWMLDRFAESGFWPGGARRLVERGMSEETQEKLIAWFSQHLEVGLSRADTPPEHVGPIKEGIVEELRAMAPTLTRNQFMKWKRDLYYRLREVPEIPDVRFVDLEFSYQMKPEVIWPIQKCQEYPQLTVSAKVGDLKIPDGGLQIGGTPKWVQNDDTPICPQCDRDMALLAKFSGFGETGGSIDLEVYNHGGAVVYVFGCSDCCEHQVVRQYD